VCGFPSRRQKIQEKMELENREKCLGGGGGEKKK